jgi:hypothetical protein
MPVGVSLLQGVLPMWSLGEGLAAGAAAAASWHMLGSSARDAVSPSNAVMCQHPQQQQQQNSCLVVMCVGNAGS